MVELIVESSQELPGWLESMASDFRSYGGPSRRGKKSNFGSRDYRMESRGSAGGSNRNSHGGQGGGGNRNSNYGGGGGGYQQHWSGPPGAGNFGGNYGSGGGGNSSSVDWFNS